jgi:CheY-like chemotaxis protein
VAKHTVLIVEDDADASATMREVLEDEGFAVVCASDGRQALGVLGAIEHVCVVLLDLFMPGMNGWDFLAAFRARADGASVPVVVVTSAPDRAPAGVDGVLPKPVSLGALISTADRYCPR